MRSNTAARLVAALALLVALAATQPTPGTAQGPLPASMVSPVPVEVTGGPATVDALQLAVATTARMALGVPNNAVVTLDGTQPALLPLDVSSAETVIAGLTVQAPGAPPASRLVRVSLANAIIPWSDADTLLVSNSPETVSFGKVLYTGALTASQNVRLLFHHQNGSKTQHMFITVALSNPARDVATVWIQGAVGAPSQEEVTPGHDAARSFLTQYAHHAGFLVHLPANTTVPLFLADLAPLAVTSGVAQFSLLDGPRMNVQVIARLAGEPDPPTQSYAPDFDRVHQRGAFARPQIVQTLTYTVGGPPVMMTLGADRDLLHEGQSGVLLQGNYGVVYRFALDLANPTARPATASLVMHAPGGQARGTFVIGDRVVESPLVQPNTPRTLATFHLGPQSQRTLRILTMPESGSNYPVRLLFGAS